MKTAARPQFMKSRYRFAILVGFFVVAIMVLAMPFTAVDSSSGNGAGKNSSEKLKTSYASATKTLSWAGLAANTSLPMMVGETVEVFASDCATPKTEFNLGEIVCAKTDGVDLAIADNHYMNWVDSSVNSTNGGTITQNPQYFLFSPPTADSWKATIGRVTPPDASIIGNPPIFNVGTGPAIATYAADCLTPKTSFTLGDTVCAKVSGVDPAFSRRIAWVDPSGLSRTFAPILNDPQTESFMLPTNNTSVIDIFVVDNRGRWRVNVVAGKGNTVISQTFLVNGTTATANLSISKSQSGESPTPGDSVTFLIAVTNNGPAAAENVSFSDPQPANATFGSVNQISGPDFACTGSDPVVCERGTTSSPLFLPPGEVAVFELTYTASGASGSSITNVATVVSDTAELDSVDNTAIYTVTIGGGSGAPAECVLDCPPSLTVATNTTGDPGVIVTFATAEAQGNCGTLSSTPASGSFFPVGTTAVTVSSSVGGGSCTFTVTVIDSPSPTISCPANQTVEADSGQSTANVSVGSPTATGSGVVITSRRDDVLPVTDPYPIGTTNIVWTATDEFERVATCTQTITVTPAEALTISCPANVSADSPSGCDPATVNPGTPTTNSSTATVTGVRSDNQELSDPYPVGVTTITWTATDTDGQSATCTQTVTVTSTTDTTPPVLNVPAGITVTTSSCSATLDDELGVATAEEECGTVNISRTGIPQVPCPTPGNPFQTCDSFVFPTGTTVITYTATSGGGTTTATQLITVIESPAVNPTITAPNDVTVNTGPGAVSCGTFVSDATLGTASANDNCPGVAVTRSGVPAGNNFPVGNTTVTYTATDKNGNIATDTQVVTVVDNTVPVITSVPSGGQTDAGSCSATIPDVATGTVASDNCGGVVITQTPAAGTAVGLGTHTITVRATDGAGNFTEATTTFTVNALQFTGDFWIGLKNSDDVGTKFDLLLEVFRNGSPVGSNQINNLPSGSSGFNNAILRTLAGTISSVGFCTGDTLSVKLSVRVATSSPPGHSSGTIRLWYNGAAANSRFSKVVNGVTTPYYLRTGLLLNEAPGSTQSTIDVLINRNQNGNAFKPFGTWVKTF